MVQNFTVILSSDSSSGSPFKYGKFPERQRKKKKHSWAVNSLMDLKKQQVLASTIIANEKCIDKLF